jgi:hypothetical protein
MALKARVYLEIVPVTKEERDREWYQEIDYYVQLPYMTKNERAQAQNLMERGEDEDSAIYHARQWYRLDDEAEVIEMSDEEFYNFQQELHELGHDQEAFEEIIQVNTDYPILLTPDMCKKLYGDFLTHLTEAEEAEEDIVRMREAVGQEGPSYFLELYTTWMRACRQEAYIYIR